MSKPSPRPLRHNNESSDTLATCSRCKVAYRPYFKAFERFFWRRPCPSCGSTSRCYPEQVEEKMQFYESWSGQVKNDAFRGKKKVRGWFFSGDHWSVSLKKFVHKSVSADKRTDTYHERVTDLESGKIIHECNERLRDHQGHGSAKPG